jgi:hypothetical protein
MATAPRELSSRRVHAVSAAIAITGAACSIFQVVASFRGVWQFLTVQLLFVAAALDATLGDSLARWAPRRVSSCFWHIFKGAPPTLRIGLLIAAILIGVEFVGTLLGFALFGGLLGLRPRARTSPLT